MKPAVSIIVPVYNAEKTLKRCLDSLVNQTLKELEIICVDDGSTDQSGEICDEYARKDPRFKVFHKKNEGVSATRQFGVENASGQFIIHLDADDYASPDAYKTMYEFGVSKNADIIICDAIKITDCGTEYMDFSLKKENHEEMINDLFSSFGSVWNRMIRLSLIKETGASFPEYLQYGEDKVFLAKLLGRSYQNGHRFVIHHLSKALINYDTSSNPVSLSKQTPGTFAKSRVNMLTEVGKEIDLDRFGKAYYCHLYKQAYSVLRNISEYGYTESEFINVFSPFRNGIKKMAPMLPQKTLVLIALDKGYKTAFKWRWILTPIILLDKIKNWKNKQ